MLLRPLGTSASLPRPPARQEWPGPCNNVHTHVILGSAAMSANVSSSSRTVLVVDDDAGLRSAVESVLTGLGYRVLTAASGDAAYAILAAEPVHAMLLDVRLPTLSGPALYVATLSRWPELRNAIAFATADADAPDVRAWLELHACVVIRKPYGVDEIVSWLRDLGRGAAGERAAS